HTPVGGKKTKILFRDIKKIDWDKNSRIHTVTTADGKTQKLERAWIFAGGGAYLAFTGTDKASGEDANGTISGSDIAAIEFSGAAPAPAQPTADTAQTSPTPEPATAQAQPTSSAAPVESATTGPGPAKQIGSGKRLSTNNLDYTKDAIAEFEKDFPGLVAVYDKAKADKTLTTDEKDPNSSEMELKEILIQSNVHQLFHGIVKNYVAAMNDGWEVSDAELAPYNVKLAEILPKLAKVGYQSCFNPDDAGCDNLENMDRARLKAYKAMLLTTARNDPKTGQELMGEVDKTVEQLKTAFENAKQAGHSALKRFQTEIDRLKKACEAGFAAASKAKETALGAWQALRDEQERLRPVLYKIENGQIHPDTWATFLDELEKFEKTESAVVKQKIESLGKICGANQETLEAAMEKLLGKNPSGWDWSAEVTYFDKIFKAIPALRKELGEAVADRAKQDLEGMGSYDEAIRAQKFEELKKLVQLGLRFDPHNTALVDLAPKVEEAATGDVAAIEKQIAERQWPGNHKGFSGPGTPDELNKAALDYFNSTCKPTEKALAACIVEPDWYCFKRNIFGEPVQWALTFWVAVDVQGETTPDIVYAWSISFITEENVGVAKAPPFKWAAFNFKQKMKRANVPGLK
ncbi:MAG TPA: hypothetical protein PKM25_05530, partial [Candidatus Ozemobacteraceae bacterium]|nr:hypothetical protein [Candidatus Ozemobacteraceae bacterium]